MAGTDFGVNFGAGLAVNIVTAVGRQARYCYEFNEFVTDLGDEQENLISTRDGMQRQLDKDKANSKEPSGDLQLQVKAANYLIDRVEKLKGTAEAKQSCCFGVCPNWMCRYFVGKKAEEKTEAMKILSEKLRQKLLSSHRLSLRYMLPSEDFILFKCTEEARNKILTALRDDENIKIGLCGMGGCGKTSLLREVHKELQDSKLYKTAFAVVSNPPNYQAIQDSIANWIGLEFETEKNIPDRAARLSMAFEEDKKYLIFLDDVWEVLDFKAIGIPVREKCKVLLSTRQQHIFELMKFDAVIYMSLLTKEEAWELFQKHAGEIKEPFQQVAREITDECHRLPVAIKAVASTLRGKELFAWIEALATLKDRRHPLNIEKGLEDPYRCLKFSFDELKDPEEVSLFLLCALFPNDSEIAIEVLIRFAFGLGIFLDINSYQRARSKVRTTIDKLKDYCLLLQEGQHVKLHDMFHALALWEAKKKTQLIMGPRQIVTVTEANYLKDTNRLYCHGIEEFPDQLNCPELEILIVSNNGGCSSKLEDMFFKGMTKLKVLAINNTCTGTKPNLLLPQSIEGLKMLRTLCLRGWTLINISLFEKLEMLDTLELLDCVMKELPKELANLKALKLLQVANCKIGGNPYKVLATCSHLEELYFVENNLVEMVQIGQNVPEFFHQIGSSKELQRYHLEIGGSINTSKDDSTSKLISINNFDSSITNETFQALPQTLEVLLFEKVQGDCNSIIPDFFPIQGECLNEVKEFVLRDSDCIKCLIDTKNDQLYQARILFAKLEKLKLEAMQCLEALCHGPPPSGLFEKLRELFITNCSQMTTLFTTSTAQKMGMLEVLKVIDCGKLRYMIKVENDNEYTSVGPVLLNLKQISVKRCKNLKCILPISIASGLLHLETLEIEDVAGLRYVFGEENHEKDQNRKEISIDLSDVKIFKLIKLTNIISICPQDYDVKLPLDKAIVMACPGLNGIFDLDSEVRQQDGDEAMKQAQILAMFGDEDFRDGIARYLSDASPRKDQFNSLVRSLHEEKHMLLVKIKELEANTVEPSGDLQQQLKEAQDLILKVEKLEVKAKTSKSCYYWVCPKWINQYNVGKRFARMTRELKHLNKRLASDSFTPMITCRSSGTFIFFESRRMAYEDLLTAVKDNKFNMIGLCGMGGCGKTFLALEICKVAENLKLFDKVVFVVVSGDPNITTIQDEIASAVGLRFYSSVDESERAVRLKMKLSGGGNFLIVLDDLWEVLKLEDIGIPARNDCKLILTTRDRHICTLMECHEEIYLSLLTEAEAWALFRTHAVVTEDTFKDLSLEFAKECQGLPITIASLSRSLKDRPEVVWKEALKKLKGYSASHLSDHVAGKIYACLKLCIEYLLSDELRSLVLLCALFSYDSNINLKILIKFTFGLGIFEGVDSHERARWKVGAAIDNLVDSGLLLAKEGQFIHMHGLVREVTLRVAHETRTHMVVQEASSRRIFEGVTRLFCYNIYEFPYQLNLPELEILYVSNFCELSPKLTDAFFQKMIELKVLAIINTFAQGNLNLLLPRSIAELKNLRTLCLNGWILHNLSILGELKMLETIELLSCRIEELPNELAKLRKLRSLEVSRTSIGCDPFEVLADCSQLEELYFVGNNLHETVSYVHVVQLLHQIGSSEVLQRYHLEIGISSYTLDNDLRSRFISLNDFDFDALPSETINSLAQKLEVVFLDNFKGHFHNIIPGIISAEGECMNELIDFSLCNSGNIECLIDNMSHQLSHDKTVFSKLLELRLIDMWGLRALCYGEPPSGLFEKLEGLVITCCVRLRSIFSSDMLNLSNLKYLKLRECGNLEYLFTYSTAQTMISLQVLKVKYCDILKHIITFEGVDDIVSARIMFPKLKQVTIWRCHSMRYMMPASFAGGLSELKILKIKEADELEYVFGGYNDGIVQNLKIDLPVLKVFKLVSLAEIISIVPENCHISCPSLDGLHLRGCPNLISTYGLDSKESQQIDDEATKQDLLLSTTPIGSMKVEYSNSEPESFKQDSKSLDDEQEAIVTKDEECCNDDDAEDKGGKEAEQDKEEKHGMREDKSRVIEQGATSCVESRELDEELIRQHPKVELELPLVLEYQPEALEEHKASKYQLPSEEELLGNPSLSLTTASDSNATSYQQMQSDDLHEFQAAAQCNTKVEKVSIHKYSALEESTVGTSSEVLIDKQPQIVIDPQQALQEYKEEEEEEDYHDDDGEDMDKKEEKHKEVEYAIQEESTRSCQESKEVDEAAIGNPYVDSLSHIMASGSSEVVSIHQNKEVPLLTGLAYSNKDRDKETQRGNNDIPSGSQLLKEDGAAQEAEEVHPHSQEFKLVDTQEGHQKQKFCPVDSMNPQESCTKIGMGSLHKDTGLEESKVGTSTKVEFDVIFAKVQDTTDVHPQSKEVDVIVDTQEGLQEQNFCSFGPTNSRESNMETTKVLIEKQPQIVLDPQQALQEYKVSLPLLEQSVMLSPSSTSSTTTSPTSEAQVSSSKHQRQIAEDEAFVKATGSHIHLMKQDGTSAVDIQEQHLYTVCSMNSGESSTEIVKGSLHKDSLPNESTVDSSLQVKIELSQVPVKPQVLEEYEVSLPLPIDPTVLSPSTSITTTLSSTNQHPPSEEFVDFHGLFKIKETRAHLLEEAFIKYPHLWEWKLSQKTVKICKVGYKSLADMLAFLKSETPKTMNESKMEEFENLYYEVEYFGFDKMWLTSIRQRVMDMQADHNNKLKQVDQLESQISNLEEQLSDARASVATVKEDLSKPGHVFGF